MTTIEKIRAEIKSQVFYEGFDEHKQFPFVNYKRIEKILDKYEEQEPKVTTTSTDEPMVIQYPQVDGITPTVVKAEQEPTSPCDLCRYNPPSSCDGKPCTMCPAEKGGE